MHGSLLQNAFVWAMQVVLAGEKVAQINKALQRAMRARSPKIYLNPLVTSHATQGQLEDALSLIKEAKEAQLKRESSNSQASASGILFPSRIVNDAALALQSV